VLNTGGDKVRLGLSRRWPRVVVAAAAAALIGACKFGEEAPSARAGPGDSAPGGLAHLNGAALDTASRSVSPPASAVVANGSTSNGSASHPGRAAETSVGSAAVAPTPDELSALAASLVVPVAGVTPAELHGSFQALRGGGTRQHNALDIPAPRGTPVISATPGRVLRLFNSKAGGLMIYAADATERFIVMYGHLDRYADGIKDGMPLARGQTIGYVGTTGNAPPNVPHLHFAISRTDNVSRWWNGTPIDPAPLFKR
jgi:murein DD-endopeptidase MepM/ murein hydrolase activator NlpD